MLTKCGGWEKNTPPRRTFSCAYPLTCSLYYFVLDNACWQSIRSVISTYQSEVLKRRLFSSLVDRNIPVMVSTSNYERVEEPNYILPSFPIQIKSSRPSLFCSIAYCVSKLPKHDARIYQYIPHRPSGHLFHVNKIFKCPRMGCTHLSRCIYP